MTRPTLNIINPAFTLDGVLMAHSWEIVITNKEDGVETPFAGDYAVRICSDPDLKITVAQSPVDVQLNVAGPMMRIGQTKAHKLKKGTYCAVVEQPGDATTNSRLFAFNIIVYP